MNMQSRTHGDFAKETRERRLRNIRQQVKGGTYRINEKLDAAIERMIDVEGFSSRPPVTTYSQEFLDDEFQRQTESDR